MVTGEDEMFAQARRATRTLESACDVEDADREEV